MKECNKGLPQELVDDYRKTTTALTKIPVIVSRLKSDVSAFDAQSESHQQALLKKTKSMECLLDVALPILETRRGKFEGEIYSVLSRQEQKESVEILNLVKKNILPRAVYENTVINLARSHVSAEEHLELATGVRERTRLERLIDGLSLKKVFSMTDAARMLELKVNSNGTVHQIKIIREAASSLGITVAEKGGTSFSLEDIKRIATFLAKDMVEDRAGENVDPELLKRLTDISRQKNRNELFLKDIFEYLDYRVYANGTIEASGRRLIHEALKASGIEPGQSRYSLTVAKAAEIIENFNRIKTSKDKQQPSDNKIDYTQKLDEFLKQKNATNCSPEDVVEFLKYSWAGIFDTKSILNAAKDVGVKLNKRGEGQISREDVLKIVAILITTKSLDKDESDGKSVKKPRKKKAAVFSPPPEGGVFDAREFSTIAPERMLVATEIFRSDLNINAVRLVMADKKPESPKLMTATDSPSGKDLKLTVPVSADRGPNHEAFELVHTRDTLNLEEVYVLFQRLRLLGIKKPELLAGHNIDLRRGVNASLQRFANVKTSVEGEWRSIGAKDREQIKNAFSSLHRKLKIFSENPQGYIKSCGSFEARLLLNCLDPKKIDDNFLVELFGKPTPLKRK